MTTSKLRAFATAATLALATSPLLTGCSSGPSAADFQEAFDLSVLDFKKPSEEYIEPTPYEITDFALSEAKNATGGPLVRPFKATAENDSFTVELAGNAVYVEDEASLSPFSFTVTDSKATAKKGIDFIKNSDGTKKPVDCELAKDAQSCTATLATSLWFADSAVTRTYVFTDNAWKESSANEAKWTYTYHDLEGNYAGKTSPATNITAFTVRDLDPQAGTFAIDYTATAQGLFSDPETVTGTLTAAIEPNDRMYSDGVQADGLLYEFEAKGSSSGGNGQATARGRITTSSSDEHVIELLSFSAESNNGWHASASGMLFMQGNGEEQAQ